MGLQLPGELISLLGLLGYNWPEADEEQLYDLGSRWMTFSGTLSSSISGMDDVAASVWQTNSGDAISAFQQNWSDPESPPANLRDGADGANLIGVGLLVAAGIVLTLKINVIVQLTMLAIEIAQAVATAPETFGASLAEIPIFKEITGLIINELLSYAVSAVLDG